MHYILANLLMDIENSGEFLFSPLLYSAEQRSLNRSVLWVLKNLNARLCVVVKVSTRPGYVMCKPQFEFGKESARFISNFGKSVTFGKSVSDAGSIELGNQSFQLRRI